jgi:hypothetical protein
VTKDNAIEWIEGSFTCEMGAPWRWADLLMSKKYTWITLKGSEHQAASKLITQLGAMKQTAGYKPHARPKLYWRWEDKVRWLEGDNELQTRVYLDGNPMPDIGNPSKPRGRPTVGQVRMAA